MILSIDIYPHFINSAASDLYQREEFEHKLHKQREELLEASNMSADDKKMMIQIGDLKSESEKVTIDKADSL